MKTQVERMLRVFVVLGLMLLSAVMATLVNGSPPSKADTPQPQTTELDRWSLAANELESIKQDVTKLQKEVSTLGVFKDGLMASLSRTCVISSEWAKCPDGYTSPGNFYACFSKNLNTIIPNMGFETGAMPCGGDYQPKHVSVCCRP